MMDEIWNLKIYTHHLGIPKRIIMVLLFCITIACQHLSHMGVNLVNIRSILMWEEFICNFSANNTYTCTHST